jgi:putative transposase
VEVFIPKCRRKTLYVECSFPSAAERRSTWNLDGILGRYSANWPSKRKAGLRKAISCRVMFLMISIPPKYVVSQVIGFIKSKSAIHLARVYVER